MHRSFGEINGKPVSFIIDTSATYVSLDKQQADKLGIDYQKVGEKGKAENSK